MENRKTKSNLSSREAEIGPKTCKSEVRQSEVRGRGLKAPLKCNATRWINILKARWCIATNKQSSIENKLPYFLNLGKKSLLFMQSDHWDLHFRVPLTSGAIWANVCHKPLYVNIKKSNVFGNQYNIKTCDLAILKEIHISYITVDASMCVWQSDSRI